MDWGLTRDIGTKALMAGAGALLLYWTISALKLVLSARGINPLIKQFFTQVASGQVDGAYLSPPRITAPTSTVSSSYASSLGCS